MTHSLLSVGNPVKGEVDRIAGSLVKVLTPTIGTDIDISAKAQLTAAIKLILDESFLKVIDRMGYIVDHAKKGASELVDQIVAGLSKLRGEIEAIVDKFIAEFNPKKIAELIKEKLIDPFFEQLNKFEDDFFKDLDELLQKIDILFTGTIEDIRLDLVRALKKFSVFDAIFALFDPCRDKLDIPKITVVDDLTDSDLYALTKCHLLERLQAEDKLENIKRVYGDIQQAAWKMTCVFRNAPNAKKEFFDDWIEYGQLIDLWRRFPEDMTALEAAQEAVRRLETARDEFLVKVADINFAQQTANDAVERAKNAQNTANQAVSGVSSLQSGIQNGSVVAQKALMLKARDDNHWLRFNKVDGSNHDVFMLWRNDDQWFSTIRVQASDKLLARNDSHWMRHKGVDSENHDCYGLWRDDGVWFNLIQVAATGSLP